MMSVSDSPTHNARTSLSYPPRHPRSLFPSSRIERANHPPSPECTESPLPTTQAPPPTDATIRGTQGRRRRRRRIVVVLLGMLEVRKMAQGKKHIFYFFSIPTQQKMKMMRTVR